MRGGSGRPARIKSRNMKKLLFTLLFCAAAAAAAGSEPAELKLLSYNIRYIGAPGDEGDFAWDACRRYRHRNLWYFIMERMQWMTGWNFDCQTLMSIWLASRTWS